VLTNNPTKEQMERALRLAGFRITKQRRAILEYLSSTRAHPSARKVFQKARKKYPELSKATVYNTLGTLVQMGLIKLLEFDALDNRYDNNLAPHINLLCTSCGKIQDWEEGLSVRPEMIKEKIGFEVLDYRIEYYGICAQCRVLATKKR
jgi:Fur family peroxide stress response transcriptional regulator